MYIVAGRGFGQAPTCTSTNCSAVSVQGFDKQPADLQLVLANSFPDPARWFEKLDRERRVALTSIYNRLCQYRLWCHVGRVLRIVVGEPPVARMIEVPGRTPSVYFISLGKDALFKALMATGRFCIAHGIGAREHPGQTSLREISTTDSLHISLGPGDQFDAHIDKYSPVRTHPGSSFCPNDPAEAAIAHIGREVVPETVRKKTGIPGVQVFPEWESPTVPRPEPPRQESGPPPPIVGITLRFPRRRR